MFDFDDSIFDKKLPPIPRIPPAAKVIFVADMFVEDYVGGAELTSEALIKSSPVEVYKLRSRDVSLPILQQGSDRFWIFGNFAEVNPQLIPSIIGNLKYSILEYDYKYCRARSPEKHLFVSGLPCDCHNQMNGKIVSAFFYGAKHLWWMSERQKERYTTMFPFLSERDNTVLSSVFDVETLSLIKALRSECEGKDRKGWLVLGSDSWIKGANVAEAWCTDNKKEYEVVWNLPYHQLLQRLAQAEGFVYLPSGGDTCPRMVIEARLLGCKLQLNDFVQHRDEEWFATDDVRAIEEYLYTAPKTFWNGILQAMDRRTTISGYTTTFNCVTQRYPFEQSIMSMLVFCDEVCIVDGGSTDETFERLVDLAYPGSVSLLDHKRLVFTEDLRVMSELHRSSNEPYEFPAEFPDSSGIMIARNPKVRVKVIHRDWNHPRFAVFDGMQKAEARAMCTGDFCWQMDSDEVVHEDDAPKVIELTGAIPKDVDILSLPVIEYWGGPDKVRADIQPWKWRLSRNKPNITHGIPNDLKRWDVNGFLHAAQGTDGCDMIDASTGERLPHVSFYTPDIERIRQSTMSGNEASRQEYEQWFNATVNGLPGVFHYSWYDLPRKIRLYRDYWTRHWNSLYDVQLDDIAENNMMFDVSWAQVTDEMISGRAKQMKEKLGGWIWHRKWDGLVTTPAIQCNRIQPEAMR